MQKNTEGSLSMTNVNNKDLRMCMTCEMGGCCCCTRLLGNLSVLQE